MDKVKYFEDRVNTFRDSDEIVEYLDEMFFEEHEEHFFNELSQHVDGLWVLVNELLDHIKGEKNG